LAVDEALDALRSEMKVEPTGDFQAHIRARVERDRMPSRFSGRARLALAAAGAATVVVIAIWPRSVTSIPHKLAETSVPAAAATRSLPEPQATPAPRVGRPPRAMARTPAAVRPATAALVAEPDLRVITTQPDLLRRLWVGRDLTQHASPDLPPWPPPVVEIAVTPITVDPIVIATAPDTGSSGAAPVIRRVSAEADSRSFR
jgi:hypothetical protein